MVEVNEESRLLLAEASARDRMLALREAALKRREKELSSLEDQVADNDSSNVDASSNQLALSNSDVDGCVAALFVPAKLSNAPVEFDSTPLYQTATIVPARFTFSEKQVYKGKRPANPNIVVNYQSRFEDLLIRPAHRRSELTPATFEQIQTTVELKPEYLDWQPCEDSGAFCANMQQAELTAIERTVLKSPMQLRTSRVPATIRQIEVRTPIQDEQSVVGGYVELYETVEVQNLAADEQVEVALVEPSHTTIETWRLSEAARVELRPVICADELAASDDEASSLLGRLRKGLNDAGYKVSSSGNFDRKLKAALRQYQRDNGLALSDALPSIESLSALGAYP